MLVKNVKVCTHCKKQLPVTEFYVDRHSKDGLQNWCKSCKNESNRKNQIKIKNQKRNTELKRLSHYHLKHGLEYELKGDKLHKGLRKYVVYKCLDCGKEVESKVTTAWEHKFKCDDCLEKSLANKPQKRAYRKKNVIKTRQEPYEIPHFNVDKLNNVEQKPIRRRYYRENDPIIKVIVVPVPQPQTENRFTKWLKGLFGKKDLQ